MDVPSNGEETLAYLQKLNSHLSWSSQGRGYFLDDNITKTEEQITKQETWRAPGEHSSGPLSCFDSQDNRERKKRVNELSVKMRNKILQAHGLLIKFSIFCTYWA